MNRNRDGGPAFQRPSGDAAQIAMYAYAIADAILAERNNK